MFCKFSFFFLLKQGFQKGRGSGTANVRAGCKPEKRDKQNSETKQHIFMKLNGTDVVTDAGTVSSPRGIEPREHFA